MDVGEADILARKGLYVGTDILNCVADIGNAVVYAKDGAVGGILLG